MSAKKATTATKKQPKAKAKQPAKQPQVEGQVASGKFSALDAAAKVLAEAKEPLNCKAMIDAMATKGYWKSPGGQTPHATLYSSILKEVTTKGKESRFVKVARGQFALRGGK
jgi:HB1, ASXL, restriction endonuclease HTH domain